MVVRLDQDRNYPEFLIYHFINEDCFDSNPLPGCVRAEPDQPGPGGCPGCQEHRPAVSACTLGSLVTLETGLNTHTPPAPPALMWGYCDRTTEKHNQVSSQHPIRAFFLLVLRGPRCLLSWYINMTEMIVSSGSVIDKILKTPDKFSDQIVKISWITQLLSF